MRWLSKALLVLTSIVLSLVVIEAGLRLLGIEYPNFYWPDPPIGGKLRPGTKGYWLKEGGGYVSINSDGLRDREHSLEKPPNTLRIAVLGDSYTQANEVNQEEAYWAVMEEDLQGCSNLRGKQVEAINFGIAGLSTTQELLILRHRVWKYFPDIVLLAIYTNNDVAENSKILASQWNFKDYFPYYTYQNGELVLDDRRTKELFDTLVPEERWPWWLSWHMWAKDNIRIVQLVQQMQRVAGELWGPAPKQGESAAAPVGPVANNFDAVYLEPTGAAWQEAWKITEGVLLMMRDEIAAQGAKFFVVVLTHPMQVNPDPSVRTEYMHKLGIQDLFYPDRRLENFCQQAGIPVLLLAPTFQEYATKHQVYFHGFRGKFGIGGNIGNGHWNQNGHRLAGHMLAKWLCGQLN